MMEKIEAPWAWIEESEDEDDIFMPPPVGSKARAEWDKRQEKKKAHAKKSEADMLQKAKSPWDWIEESKDEDDIFMPPSIGSKARAEWDKRKEKKKEQAKKSNDKK